MFPFTDTVSVITLNGKVLREVLEKGLSLDYGLAQFSGVKMQYDSRQPRGRRLISAEVGGRALESGKTYTLATMSFTATGGENYTMLSGLPVQGSDTLVSAALMDELRRLKKIEVPKLGRQLDLARTHE